MSHVTYQWVASHMNGTHAQHDYMWHVSFIPASKSVVVTVNWSACVRTFSSDDFSCSWSDAMISRAPGSCYRWVRHTDIYSVLQCVAECVAPQMSETYGYIYIRPTQSIMYVPLQVNRFQKNILLIVQYKYLKSCFGDFHSPESDPPHKIMR